MDVKKCERILFLARQWPALVFCFYRLKVTDLEAESSDLKKKLAKATADLSELTEELYQLKVTLKLFDTQSLLSQLATSFVNRNQNLSAQVGDDSTGSPASTPTGVPPLILPPVENEKDRFRKWAKCLPLAR